MDFNHKKLQLLTEISAAFFLLLNIVLVSLYYSSLPEQIPNHFTFLGLPNDIHDKKSIWALPVVGSLLYFILTGIAFFVRQVGRPDDLSVDVTRLVTRMLRQLKLLFSFIMCYLVAASILIGQHRISGLGWLFSPLVMGLLAIVLIVNFFQLLKMQFPRKRN